MYLFKGLLYVTHKIVPVSSRQHFTAYLLILIISHVFLGIAFVNRLQ